MGETEEQNKTTARRLLEGFWSTGDAALASELFTADFLHHHVPEGTARGPEGQRQFVASVREAFSDLQFFVEDVIAEGDKVAVRWRTQFRAADGGIETGEGVDILRFSNGKVAELWSFH